MSEDYYMGRLYSLRELSTQQRGLCQLSSQVDSCHGNYMECRSELGALQGERERLEAERLRLSERISEIDKDLTQTSGVCQELVSASEQSVLAAPLEDYSHTLAAVNTAREGLSLHLLPNSSAYTTLAAQRSSSSLVGGSEGSRKRRRRREKRRVVVVGPSYKPCPRCGQEVPRNAVTCSKCAGSCSTTKRRKKSK